MSRTLSLLLLLCAAAASAAAASSKNPDFENAVKSQLVGKTFTTKILVGSYIPCPNSGNNAIKPVDTELSPDGSIKYYARANCYFPGGFSQDFVRRYVTGGELSGKIVSGSLVWVRGVDFKEDRIEVRLSTNNNDAAGGSGKIKYMFGTEYRTWSEEVLMTAIARGIVIPAYEKVASLKTEYEGLRVSLQAAEQKYNLPAADADSKLADAIALKQVLEKLQQNRAAFTSLGKSDPDAGTYSQKLIALTPEITRLTEEAHKRRVALLQDQLKKQLAQISEVQTQVRLKAPSSLAEWQQRSDNLDKYSTLLDERQKLLDELQNEKEVPSPDDVKNLTESRAEIQTVRASLQSQKQQIELADLNSQFAQLSKKRAQLLDAYSRAFATPKEAAAKQDLIAVLNQIVTNRDQAAGLGDTAAANQLAKCRAEAEKYKKK